MKSSQSRNTKEIRITKSSDLISLYKKGILQKRSAKWFRKLGGIEGSVNLPYEVRNLIAKKSLEAIPKRLIRYLAQEPELLVISSANMASTENYYDFYDAIKQSAEGSDAYKWYNRREEMWKIFKSQGSSVYNSYIAWMQRHGVSGTYYFYDNSEYESGGTHGVVHVTLDLSLFQEGKKLEFTIDFYDKNGKENGHLVSAKFE